ncbi:MAG TPA: ABC transporter permease [Longimicrobiales bacterium]|nr:ABC transporter permease [Longimicrobiales bacterium]
MNLAHTVKLAARALGRNRGVTALAVITLGLGIGATTFMFSIVHGALYRGLPFLDGDRIMRVWAANPTEGWDRSSVEYLDYLEMKAEQKSLVELAAGYSGTVNVSTGERAIRLDGSFLTANAIAVLGVRPVLGRGFLPGEDAPGAAPVIILSNQVWQDEFDGDPAIVGRGIRVNGEASTVVGVMPRGFQFPEVQAAWVTMRRSPAEERNTGTDVLVFGRLRDGVSREAAQAELSAIAGRLASEFPETNADLGVNVTSFTDMGSETTTILLTMLGVVGLILLVACTNVANLLLARTATRTREIAVRTALGAGRRRLIGQLIAEAGVLAAAGAVLGAAGAWVAMRWFSEAIAFTDPPFWFVFAVDGPILVFVVLIAGFAAVVSGVIPGIKATGGDIQAILQDDSRGSSSMRLGRLSRGLVVAEIALSLGLLVVAGLMARGILERRNLDLPFPTESVFTARMGLFESEYPGPEARQAFYDQLLRALQDDPAIRAAALTSALPGSGAANNRVAIQGVAYAEERDQPRARSAMVSPGFFETFEAVAVRGRVIDERDTRASLPVVVINESFAAELFPGEDPIARQVRLGAAGDDGTPWRTIVGVVPDLAMEGVYNEPGDIRRGLYVPLAQDDTRFVSVAVRAVETAAGALSITPAVRAAVQRLSPDTPLYWVRTLQEGIDRNLWTIDIFGGMMIVFGLIALVMAIAGLYGVTAFSVGRRTHEVGIRMAVGAAAGDVLRLVMQQSAVQIAIGLTLGLGLAAGLAMAMQDVLFRVEPLDPVVYLGITGILTTTALVASAIPAIRASRVDPARALRRD